VPVAAAFAVVVVADSHRRPLSLLLLLLAGALAGEGHEAGRAVNRVRAGVSGIRGVDVEAGAVYCSICRNPLRIQRSYSNNPSAAVSGLPSVIARPTSRPHNFRSPHEHFPRLPVADGHGPPPAHGAHRRRRRRDGGGRAAGILRRGGRGGAGGGGGPGGGRHVAGAGARNRHDVLRVHGSRRGAEGGGAGSACGRAIHGEGRWIRVRAGVSGIRGVDVEAGAVYIVDLIISRDRDRE
jgi:hypothetical protein